MDLSVTSDVPSSGHHDLFSQVKSSTIPISSTLPYISYNGTGSRFQLPTTTQYLQYPATLSALQYGRQCYASTPYTLTSIAPYRPTLVGIPTTWTATLLGSNNAASVSMVSPFSCTAASIPKSGPAETDPTVQSVPHDCYTPATECVPLTTTAQKRKYSETVESAGFDNLIKGSNRRLPKPPYGYIGMMVILIENAPEKRLTLRELYERLGDMFPFFKGGYTGWKDSVRHNVSASKCFYKEKMEKTDPRRRTRNCCYWRVDLNLVFPDVFRRQENSVARAGKWAPYLHEQLGIPEVVLPWQSREDIKSMKFCRKLRNTVKRKKNTQSVEEESQGVTKSAEVVSRDVKMTLPAIDPCNLSFESPDVRGGPETSSMLKMTAHCVDISPVKYCDEPKQARPSQQPKTTTSVPLPDMTSLISYIRSLNQPQSTMIAAENLSSLCDFTKEHDNGISEIQTINESMTGSWSPISSCASDNQIELATNKQHDISTAIVPSPGAEEPRRNSKDFSISSLLEEYIDVE